MRVMGRLFARSEQEVQNQYVVLVVPGLPQLGTELTTHRLPFLTSLSLPTNLGIVDGVSVGKWPDHYYSTHTWLY